MNEDVKCNLEQRLRDRGYDLEELEQDNPFNAWFYEERLALPDCLVLKNDPQKN